MTLPDLLLLSLAAVGGGWDLATRKIPNWLTFPMMVAGLVWNSYRGGWQGGLLAACGFALGLGMLVLGMGFGDVKMMAAAGALTGPQGLLMIFIYTALLGGVVALIWATVHGKLRATLVNTVALVRVLGRGRLNEARNLESATRPLPYGAVIAGGCVLYWWMGPKSL